MQALIAPLAELAEFESVQKICRTKKGIVQFAGCEFSENTYDVCTQRWF